MNKLILLACFAWCCVVGYTQVIINEIMPKPSGGDVDACIQSMFNTSNAACGSEWIELFNTSPCDTVDLSCYLIGSRTSSTNNAVFQLPNGTKIAPLGFLTIGGGASGATVIIPSYQGQGYTCGAASRWFLENTSGWIALYAPGGTPVNGVFWSFNANDSVSLNTNSSFTGGGPSCLPANAAACGTVANLAGIQSFPANRISYAGQIPNSGFVLKRNIDGSSAWSASSTATQGSCNGVCLTSSVFTVNATIVQPTCGQNNGSISFSPNPVASYSYVWTPNVSSTSSATSLGAGTYTVRITNTVTNCKKDTTITLNASAGNTTPITSFSYSSPVCILSATNPTPAVAAGFTSGGSYSSTAGLSLNATTGEINLAASTAGTYTVTYSVAANPALCLTAGSSTFTITLTNSITPITSFSYSNPVCILSATNPTPAVAAGFTSGGSYSSTAGLSLNATTGEINLAASTAGTYTVTYSVAANPALCLTSGSSTFTITLTNSITPVTSFSYSNPVCILSATNPTPAVAAGFTSGGSYSSTAGLSLNATTGEINLAASTAGTYTVTYSVAANPALCLTVGSSTANITINAATNPVTAFSYSTPLCKNSTNPLPVPTAGFTLGGLFSATNGLIINPTTGEVDLSNSPVGSYTVQYKVSPNTTNCINADSSAYPITITDVPATPIITGDTTVCANQTAVIFSTAATAGVNYTWAVSGSGAIVSGQGSNQIATDWGLSGGVVSLTSSNVCGSSPAATINVGVAQLPTLTAISGDSVLCPDRLDVVYTTTALPNVSYNWILPVGATIVSGQGTNAIVVRYTGNVNGNITVTPSTACGNGIPASKLVATAPAPAVDLGADTTIATGNSVLLSPVVTATPVVSYLWSNHSSLSDNTIPNPIAAPTSTYTYSLTVTDGNGCTVSDSKTIYVESNNKFYVPTAFSPNSDGRNDFFNAVVSDYRHFEMKIYNRWGELIATLNKPGNVTAGVLDGWDGSYKSAAQPTGVYVYFMKIIFTDNSEISQSGSITLIR